MKREAEVVRKTKETFVITKVKLDGTGKAKIQTPIPFLNHMLDLFAFHSGFDLYIEARGDLDVDPHHLIEDIGLALGEVINKALAQKEGINRYGFVILPMDEVLVRVAVDISGRPYLHYKGPKRGRIGDIRVGLVESFFRAMAMEAKLTLHVDVLYGDDPHHKVEGIFKGVAKALGEATFKSSKKNSIPSTKGIL